MTSNIVSIIRNIDNTNNCSLNLNTIKRNFTAKIDSNKYKIEEKYNTISDDTQEIINNNIEIDYNTNKCDGYIKVKEQLVEQNNFIDEQIQILNNIVGTTETGETGELGEIKQSITNYSNAKAKLLNNITIINNTCNLILTDIFNKYVDNENPISIKKKFTDLETDINAVSTESTDSSLSLKNNIDNDKDRLQNKKNAIVTVNDFSAESSPFSDLSSYNNTITLNIDDLMYEEVNNLCLGSNVNDSGACKQSNWGCKLSCQFLERKDGDGNQECSRLGSTANEIDYDVYENIYGETVKIHSHIHTHPGPHPHPMPDDS
tara:strand:- start:1229 stop:2182 length:954 start_codon:yes stop_codon:yes gene_type:complete